MPISSVSGQNASCHGNEQSISHKLAIVILLCAMVLTAGCKKPAPGQLVESAKTAYAKGDSQAALVLLKDALQQDPNLAQARYQVGRILNENREPKFAEQELRRAKQLGLIEGGRVDMEIARSLLLDGRANELLTQVPVSDAFEPDVASSISAFRARAHLIVRQLTEAKSEVAAASKLSPQNADALLARAHVAVATGDRAGALQVVDEVLKTQPRQFDAWLTKGDLLHAEGKREEAIAAYGKAIEILPRYFGVRVSRASLQLDLGRAEAARKEVEEMRRLGGSHPMTHYLSALVQFREGKYRDAEQSIQEARKRAPSFPPLILLSGAVGYASGSFGQAERDLSQFLKSFPDNAYARKLLTATLLELKQGTRALEVVSPAVSKDMRDTALLALAATAQLQIGNQTAATDLMEKAVAYAPASASLRVELAKTRLVGGEHAKAISDLEDAVELDQTIRSDLVLIATYLQRREHEKALEAISRMEKKQPNSPVAPYLAALANAERGNMDAARESLTRGLKIAPDHIPSAAMLARLELNAGDAKSARRRYEDIVKRQPSDARGHLGLAEVALKDGGIPQALRHLEDARRSDPSSIESRKRLALYYLSTRENRRALDIAQETVSRNPGNPEAMDLLGTTQLTSGDANSAVRTFNQLNTIAPNVPTVMANLAKAHLLSGDHTSAIAVMRRAASLVPGDISVQTLLATTLLADKKYDEVLRIGKTLASANPKSPAGHSIIGDALMAQGKMTDAAAAFETGLKLRPSGPMAVKVYMAMARSGRPQQGLDRLRDWLDQHPKDVGVRLYYAEGLLAMKRNPESQAQYEKILEQTPDNARAMNNLANIYYTAGDKRALATAERALEKAKEDPLVLDTLGWILLGQGNVKRAVELLERAVGLAPDSADTRYHYAVALAKTGNKQSARTELERALATPGGFADAAEAKRLLTQL